MEHTLLVCLPDDIWRTHLAPYDLTLRCTCRMGRRLFPYILFLTDGYREARVCAEHVSISYNGDQNLVLHIADASIDFFFAHTDRWSHRLDSIAYHINVRVVHEMENEEVTLNADILRLFRCNTSPRRTEDILRRTVHRGM